MHGGSRLPRLDGLLQILIPSRRITPSESEAPLVASRGAMIGSPPRAGNLACCAMPTMDDFAKYFCQNHDGSWTCVSAGEFNGPTGRIQVTPGSRFYRGTIFMGFDLAAWLDEELRNRAMRCENDQLEEDRRHGERRRS